MSGFSADWLALREPFDAAARSTALLDSLLRAAGPRSDWTVIDLGAGSGANLRYLSTRLPGPQHWTLVDHDPALLAVAARPGIELRTLDLAREFSVQGSELIIPRGALVTASALLDLVSADWLECLAQRCRAAEAIVHFALSYDGRMHFDPVDAFDAFDTTILDLVNRHQRGDKGFGAALGPDATQQCIAAFTRAGYTMQRARSDWQIDVAHLAMQTALIDGWADAAIEMAARIGTGVARDIDAWRRRRLERLNAAGSRLIVGHEDVIGWPDSR